MPEQRLDAALAARGLARSRTHAATLIAAGVVSVDGRAGREARHSRSPSRRCSRSRHPTTTSAAPRTSSSRRSTGSASTPPVASCSTPAHRPGASARCCSSAAHARVLAVDVGHGQLAPELRDAPGLVLVEGCNVRHLDRASLAAQTGVDEPPSLVTADLSFISLTTVLPALRRDRDRRRRLRAAREAAVRGRPRGSARGGRARRGAPRRRRSRTCSGRPSTSGLGTAGVLSSPIAGSHGNHEYLVHLSAPHGVNPTEWMRRVERLTGGANA